MFVQLIEGRVKDRAGLRKQMDTWQRELRPGATGFLGATMIVTTDGRLVNFARFDSAASARANSERPEQGTWWEATAACLEGAPTFTDSEDVEVPLGGGSDEAGFVQVMKVTGVDRDRLKVVDDAFVEHAPAFRPDVLGGLRVWTGPDSYVEANYFTSEAAAREGEQREPPAELAQHLDEFQQLMSNAEYLDCSDPWLF